MEILKTKKQNKGITLIALVITIIILIILAGISIATLTGNNGLFLRGKQAKQNTLDAQDSENTTLSEYNNTIGQYLSNSRESNTKITLYDKKTQSYKAWSPSSHTLELQSDVEKGKYIIILNGSRANQSNSSLTQGSITFDYPNAIELSSNSYNDVIASSSGAQLLTISKIYLLDISESQTISTTFEAGWAMNMNYVMNILKVE